MDRLKKLVIRILHPGMGWIVLLIPLSTAALIFTFAKGWEATLFAYISYALSAYNMIVLIINIPEIMERMQLFIKENKLGNRLKVLIYGNQYSSRYMTDISFRVKISLFSSLSMNLIYAAFKLIAGIYYASFWYGADAIYYIVLSASRVMLTRYMKKEEPGLEKEYRGYRSCGILLFVLNAALISMVYQIVHQNMGYRYPGLLIYMVATFAFVNITAAIINVIKYRKLNSPVMSAVKMLSLAKALVAMFALQSAMFASFGENDAVFERIMNSIFGGCACLAIFVMAVFMVLRANRNLKKLEGY